MKDSHYIDVPNQPNETVARMAAKTFHRPSSEGLQWRGHISHDDAICRISVPMTSQIPRSGAYDATGSGRTGCSAGILDCVSSLQFRL